VSEREERGREAQREGGKVERERETHTYCSRNVLFDDL
jgi:hypothetical protein